MPERNNTENDPALLEQIAALRALSAGVAHEIRNPLAVIQSLVQHLAQKTKDESQKKLAEAVTAEVQRLNHFLTEFLAFSKPPELQYESVSVKDLIEHALTFAPHPEQHANIRIRCDIPEDPPPVVVDPDAIHQVLLNGLKNSLQSMKGEGTLEIRARISKKHFTIQIKDTGIGIAPEQLDKVFLPFFTTKRGGTGLGLAISHQIITLHGGRLYFKKNQGKGMTLFIEVPQKTENP